MNMTRYGTACWAGTSPTTYAYIGSGNPANPNTQVAHHNAYFDIDEDALTVATAMYTCYTAEYLNRLV